MMNVECKNRVVSDETTFVKINRKSGVDVSVHGRIMRLLYPELISS